MINLLLSKVQVIILKKQISVCTIHHGHNITQEKTNDSITLVNSKGKVQKRRISTSQRNPMMRKILPHKE